jgi:hypothetical protein
MMCQNIEYLDDGFTKIESRDPETGDVTFSLTFKVSEWPRLIQNVENTVTLTWDKIKRHVLIFENASFAAIFMVALEERIKQLPYTKKEVKWED